MSAQIASRLLLLPIELQTQILSYLPFLDQVHCMCVSPIWHTIFQKERFRDVRYYDHIYPTIHRLVFEEDLEIDLRVTQGVIETAAIWKRPVPYKKKPEYPLANIDLSSKQPSILDELVFREKFSGFARDKIDKINVCLIEVILCAFSSNDASSAGSRVPWKRQWILSEQLDVGFEGMTIAKFLEFMVDVLTTSHNLGAGTLLKIKFAVLGWKTRRLEVVFSVN
ncbi:hypothetical protein TWF718_006468 [Orbilia javanica]|uniref:F-box domain-containing protein n=1 Tax=Orbilia javanica TaxID=47235 RepID=A0AAN8NYH3_9PEZI